ncbi:MAG: T9SS type A sorting domain-containing protein [Chitinophagaceae bacterium]|nr:T9SS type A sorting domain-containing protein [Chitinophagaceae bacterium]
MSALFSRRTSSLHNYFYQLLFVVVFLFPLSAAAQFKLKGERVNQSSQPSLSKLFKKYHVFTINAPELMRNSKAQGRASFKFDLELAGLQTLSLSLVEQNILSESYSMVLAGPNGIKETGRPNIKTYTGSVTNEEGSIVALTISDKTIFGHIKGKTKDYFIEPLRYYNKKAAANSFVVYETKDVVPNSGLVCGATEVAEKQTASAETSSNTLGTATGTCKIIELAIASDATIFEKYGSADLIEEHNISITNTMVLLYGNAQLGSSYLQFKIKKQYVSTSTQTDPVAPYTEVTNSPLLSGFKAWGNRGGFGAGFSFDLGQLWTMKNIIPDNGGVVGLAYLDAVCTGSRYQVNRDVFEQTGLQAGSLVAHETGHNLGADHDAPGAPYIMAPSVANPANTVFSDASIAAMTSFLTSVTCIAGCNTEQPTAGFNLPKYSCSNTINLTSASVGEVNGVFWETPGGTPERSNATSFSVQYSTPGLKTISLTAFGTFLINTVVKQVFITSPLPNGCLTRTGSVFNLGAFTNFSVSDLQHTFVSPYGRAYKNNTCEVVSFTPGQTYTYKGIVGLPAANVSSRLQVFIDYNNDGDFLDENEAVHTSPDCLMGEYSFSFTVPENITVFDKTIRMRVVGSGCGTELADGCTVSQNAQVEDFGVVFLAAEKFYYVDRDRDGYGDPKSRAWLRSATAPPGYSSNGDDCNDDFPHINPLTKWVKDVDKDGYYPGEPVVQCTSPGSGYSWLTSQKPGDCNDGLKEMNPLTVWVKDGDGDGHYIGMPVTQCESPGAGYVIKTNEVEGDCNDADDSVFETQTYYKDEDADGYGNPAKPITVCSSAAPAGYVNNSADCNDRNPAVNPGAVEVCGNKIDDNCNGVVDEVVCSPCANVTELTVTNITSNSVQFNWKAVANPDQWQLQYKATGRAGNKWNDVILTGNIRSVTVSNLAANQTYQWQLRAKCGKSWTSYRSGSNFKTSAAVAGKTSGDQLLAGTVNTAMLLYPNPSNGNFNLDLQLEQTVSGTATINVRDITGKLLLTEKVNVVNGLVRKNIQLPGYAITGMYLVEVSANGQWFKTKLIVTK